MPGSGLKVCGGWWVGGGVQTHFSDQPKSQADQLLSTSQATKYWMSKVGESKKEFSFAANPRGIVTQDLV